MTPDRPTPDTLRLLADGDDQMVWLTELGVPPPVVETMRRAMRSHAAAWAADLRESDARFRLCKEHARRIVALEASARQSLEAAELDMAPFAAQIAQRKTYTVTEDPGRNEP